VTNSLDFLTPDANGDAIARSPMEREALTAGARLELREGWNVAAEFDGQDPRLRDTVGYADCSHLTKLEVNGPHDLEFGIAERRDGAWWCPVARERALVICEPNARPAIDGAIELTTSYAALTIAGPLAREVFARFCALDLRAQSCPPRAFRPGSVARTPGYVLRENGDRFLMLFGWALGRYVWEQVADAAKQLGGGPVGVDALVPLEEELAHA
jgi:glycine cleavage system aminomethyltransferase T